MEAAVKFPTFPKCPFCGLNLTSGSSGLWVCVDGCGFSWRVERGRVSPRPMWGVQPIESAPQQVSTEETFEEWLAKHGVTKDMWKDADDRMKEDLKAAFYQRGRKDADVVLMPPR